MRKVCSRAVVMRFERYVTAERKDATKDTFPTIYSRAVARFSLLPTRALNYRAALDECALYILGAAELISGGSCKLAHGEDPIDSMFSIIPCKFGSTANLRLQRDRHLRCNAPISKPQIPLNLGDREMACRSVRLARFNHESKAPSIHSQL